MAYIGNTPAEKFSAFSKQDFTTSATTSYTLDNPVSNANEIALFINHVRQEPTTAYTAAGTALTLTSATTSSDDMYCVYLGKAVQTVNPANGSVDTAQLADGAVETAKIADSAVTSAKLSGVTQGITMAQQWSLSADTNSGSDADITSNWEEADYANYGGIGTGLTESSGIFTFPQTGIYLITGSFLLLAVSGDTFAGVNVRTTTDGTNYNTAAQGSAGNGGSSNTFNTATFQFIFDVENITTHKIKFITNSFSTGTYIYGGTDLSRSGFTVTRLGDT